MMMKRRRSRMSTCSSSRRSSRRGLTDAAVEVISRLAQWRIPDLEYYDRRTSDAFAFGFWRWHLSAVSSMNRGIEIALFPKDNSALDEMTPCATFVLTVFAAGNPVRILKKAAKDKVFNSTYDGFAWKISSNFHGPLVINVEFLDLKIWSTGDDPVSGWPSRNEGLQPPNHQHRGALGYLSRMLEEGLHSDVTIITPDGSLRAHKAVLVAASPVFQSMLTHECKEKQTSTIEMTDISFASCSSLLRHIYGTLKPEELWNHRMELLVSADKYFIGDLKARCEESLMEDVNSDNILKRHFMAYAYRLRHLERHCWTYVVDFLKIQDLNAYMDELAEQHL